MLTEQIFMGMKYLTQLPDNFDQNKKYPVIILMHGAGTRAKDTDKLRNHGFFSMIQKYTQFPCVTVAPLCSENTWFDMFETLNKFAEFISTQDYADADRIYLTGNSMGGYASWQMAMSNPTLYAALIPICGGGMYWNAARIAKMPIWAFHGDSDPVVKTEESQKMVDKINACGGNAKLTIYEDCGHNSWARTWHNVEVFEWLFSQNRKNQVNSNAIEDEKYDNSEKFG
ncbi:MAG: prolyl oligopeptidase family serine peptidase [Clostridia bacterium]|nr:prolyl oligopeptidase family serine peptidase [Clostridia bacterium]